MLQNVPKIENFLLDAENANIECFAINLIKYVNGETTQMVDSLHMTLQM